MKTSIIHAIKLILVEKMLLSFLLLLSLSLMPVLASLQTFIFILTCSQSMGLPELENVPIEDWHKYEHVPGSEVCKSAKWVPNGAFELQAMWTRIGIEVRSVVTEDNKNRGYLHWISTIGKSTIT